jgi:hypothetical protein
VQHSVHRVFHNDFKMLPSFGFHTLRNRFAPDCVAALKILLRGAELCD